MIRTKTFTAVLAPGLVLGGVALGSATAQESGTLYHVGTSSKHTNIALVSEAEIETIHGMTNDISGTFFVSFEELKGKAHLRVPVTSLRTGIETRDEHLQSDQWLDAANHPNIELVSDDIRLTARNADRGVYEAELRGKLKMHGVAKERTITATVVRLPESVSRRLGEGDWVKISAKFAVSLSDHDVSIPDPEMVGPKVEDTWDVSVSLLATTSAPKRR